MKTTDLKSIDDVAKAAGVSSATVSRVINGSASVGSKTRERVEAALRELNYRPNRSAQALARRREPVLGVVLPTLADPFLWPWPTALSECV
jgi:Transcriptional regulators